MEYFKVTSLPLILANEIGMLIGLTSSSLPEFDALENATVVLSSPSFEMVITSSVLSDALFAFIGEGLTSVPILNLIVSSNS